MKDIVYSDCLKILLNITSLSQKYISEKLHYDSSYINKWMNGRNIPSLPQSNFINDTISKIISKIVYKENLFDELSQKLNIVIKADNLVTLNKVIFNILNFSYFNSYKSKNNIEIFPEDNDYIVTEHDNIVNFLYTLLSMQSYSNFDDKDIEIFTTLDIGTIFNLNKNINILNILNMSHNINLNMFVENFDDNMKYFEIKGLEKFIRDTSYYNLNIYTGSLKNHLSYYIYVKNKFIVYFQKNHKNKLSIASYSRKTSILKDANKKLESDFKDKDKIIHSDDKYDYDKFFCENNLFTKSKMFLYSSYMDSFMIDEFFINKVLNHEKFSNKEKSDLKKVNSFKNYTFNNLSYDIVINIKELFKSIYSNKISLGKYYLTIDNDLSFYDYLMKNTYFNKIENENHQYFIMDWKNSDNFNWGSYKSIFITDNYFIAKKLDNFNTNKFVYAVCTDKEIIASLKSLIENIYQTYSIKKVDFDELRNIIFSNLKASDFLK